MKLRTEMVDGKVRPSMHNGYDVEHDLLAAHALLQAMDAEIQRVSQVPYNSREICEYFMENVNKRAAEILAGWLGEDRG